MDQYTIKLVDGIVATWHEIVVPVYTDSNKRGEDLELAGSAFVVQYKGRLFLVTAKHVVDYANKKDYVIAVINGVSVFLNGRGYKKSDADDLVVFPIDKFHAPQELKKVKGIRVFDGNSVGVESPIRIMIGFPSSVNGICRKYGKFERKVRARSFVPSFSEKPLATKIKNFVRYSYDHEDYVNSLGEKVNPTELYGCSGGPVLSVYIRSVNGGGGVDYGVELSSIAAEWHFDDREVVGISPHVLVRLMSAFIDDEAKVLSNFEQLERF